MRDYDFLSSYEFYCHKHGYRLGPMSENGKRYMCADCEAEHSFKARNGSDTITKILIAGVILSCFIYIIIEFL